ncbi:peptidase family M49-domain-containing protein [Chytridium lagenaria]|nr:peptidase family M49-domain-containing protein [Chytridium lagenaria]
MTVTTGDSLRFLAKKHFESLTDKEKFYTHHIVRASWDGFNVIAAQLSHDSVALIKLFKPGSTPPPHQRPRGIEEGSGLSDQAWTYFLEYAVQVLYIIWRHQFVPRGIEEDFQKVIEASGSSFAGETFNSLKQQIFALEPATSLLIGYPDEGHDITQDEITFVQSEEHVHEGKTITIAYGDFQHSMQLAAANMRAAKVMCEKYAESFETGVAKAWIKDVGPIVETNLGFVETYKDPAGVRAEWEGFVAVVNKEMTAKFERLVNGAADYIRRLPWGPDFEKDKFNRPDFTSLEVVNFSTVGSPPAGINIPNYDDIRMTLGFKNVSLGNVVNAPVPNEPLSFISEEDEPLYRKLRVGLHELLGHGSGKLLSEEPAGVFNFDVQNPPMNPVTGRKVDTWYKPGETWGSKFGPIAASYEEFDREILSIFAEEKDFDDVIYIAYLKWLFYDCSKKWGQAHMQARFAIFNELLRAGVASVTLSPAGDDATIRVDRTKIVSHGGPAMKDLLMKLHIYKATGDSDTGIQWYRDVTSVPDEWSTYRELVLLKKLPRKVFVQGNTFVQDGKVVFKDYPTTLEGFIDSFIERDIPL